MYNMFNIEQIDKPRLKAIHQPIINAPESSNKQIFFSFQACAVIESRQWILTEGVIMLL